MDAVGRGTFEGVLIDGIVPLVAGLADRLRTGIDVADIGCGTGHSTNLLARAFPASRFVGFDLAADAIQRACAEADDYGQSNVSYEVLDVTGLPADPPLGAVFAFDAIPTRPTLPVSCALCSRRSTPAAPSSCSTVAPPAISKIQHRQPARSLDLRHQHLLHCMTVSFAGGGAGLGTVWGEELALELLTAAGFVDIEVHEVPGDPLDSLYVARKPR